MAGNPTWYPPGTEPSWEPPPARNPATASWIKSRGVFIGIPFVLLFALVLFLRLTSHGPDLHFATSFCGYKDSAVSWSGTVTTKTILSERDGYGYVTSEFDFTAGGRSEQAFGEQSLTYLPANTPTPLNVSMGWLPSQGRVTGRVTCHLWYTVGPPGRGKA